MSDEIELTRFHLKLNTDLWLAVEKAENPEATLQARVLQEFKLQGFRPAEISAIERDPIFRESVTKTYQKTARRFRGWRHSLPGSLTFEYQTLGTQKKQKEPR